VIQLDSSTERSNSLHIYTCTHFHSWLATLSHLYVALLRACTWFSTLSLKQYKYFDYKFKFLHLIRYLILVPTFTHFFCNVSLNGKVGMKTTPIIFLLLYKIFIVEIITPLISLSRDLPQRDPAFKGPRVKRYQEKYHFREICRAFSCRKLLELF